MGLELVGQSLRPELDGLVLAGFCLQQLGTGLLDMAFAVGLSGQQLNPELVNFVSWSTSRARGGTNATAPACALNP